MRADAPPSHVATLASISALIALLLACAALFGFAAGVPLLSAFHPGWRAMAPLTACGIAVLAVPLVRRRAAKGASSMLVGGLALAELISHALLQRDTLAGVVAGVRGMAPDLAGSTSVATALCLLLLAVAAVASARRHRVATELLANATVLIAGSALLGYAYGISDLYSYYMFNTMALPTAAALFLLAVARLLAEPGSRLQMAAHARHAGGRRVRHLLALTALPALAGLLLVRVHGSTANYSFSMALLVMCTSVPMFYLLLEYAHKAELLSLATDAQQSAQRLHASELEQEVARITAELAASHRDEVDSLAQSERAKRSEVIAQLTGSIAHDFNNLLMVISGSAQLIKMQLPAGSGMLRHAEKITATVSATAKLTAQLAAFSSTQRLEAQPFLIDQVVQRAIDENLAVLPADIRFDRRLDAAEAWVLGDGAQMQLAIGHLLRNAGDALDHHGALRISTKVTPSDTREGNDSIELVVEDDGCGMTADVLANAVEPFFSTKQSGKHQGLGLAQANSVVHQASGSLHLSGAPGQGTRVAIYLPRHLPVLKPLRLASPVEQLPAARARNRRLLVIDDDDDVRGVVAELLRSLQFDVTEANDGETGLRKMQETQPALAIIDYLMPGMNGGEVARKARQQFPSLPILFISGFADSEAIAAIPHAQLLRKPIMPLELEQAVNGALN
jgi:signal transduction histidine kinase